MILKQSLIALNVTILIFTGIAQAAIYENFTVKPKWKVFLYAGSTSPALPYAATINNALQITIPYNATGDSFAAGYTTTCLFTGDFDVSVDYKLLSFPYQNGVRVGLVANNVVKRQSWGGGAEVVRISGGATEPYGESYTTSMGGDCCHPISTTARSGKLRMVRTGSEIIGYYYDSYQQYWVEINSGGSTTSFGNTPIELAIWSHDGVFADKNISVTFDNFTISKGKLIGPECPTISSY